MCIVNVFSEVIQKEFLKLIHSLDEIRIRNQEDLGVRRPGCNPRVSSNALKVLIKFSSSDLCQYGFSVSFTIKYSMKPT